jgi:branched-chain amino acid transport system ATP-binding protein
MKEAGKTILLVEQNASLALKLADRTYVLELGKVVLEGKSADIMNNPIVKRAYLGAT